MQKWEPGRQSGKCWAKQVKYKTPSKNEGVNFKLETMIMIMACVVTHLTERVLMEPVMSMRSARLTWKRFIVEDSLLSHCCRKSLAFGKEPLGPFT